jgi:SAM-dependent methyltransferase
MSLGQFVREYRTVRRAEGWGSSDAAYYRALPYRDLTHRFDAIWRIRAQSFNTFVSRVLSPLESDGSTLTVLDLGAGNGWLAYRLAKRGHRAIAIDILDDQFDGLGAMRRYACHVPAVLAEFDRLPFAEACCDLTVFNASLHYSTDYVATVREALRLLRSGGTLVILDSPMYSDPTSGERMVLEREAGFVARYGFASNALPSQHYLTPARLQKIGAALGLKWQVITPALDSRTRVSRVLGGLRARREPARFPVMLGTRA